MDLGRAFPLFKQILQSNNRALETIADMGETMGGDYLFDINYVKNSYATLSESINSSMDAFTELTKDRYHLRHPFKLIDSLIHSVMYGTGQEDSKLVVPYENISWTMAREVGGKSYHLSELSNMANLKVPAAFAITARAYTEFMEHNGIIERLDAIQVPDVKGRELATLREAVIQGDVPSSLDAAIESGIEALQEVNGSDFTLAVRSSAEDEDGEYSFAGQFLSVLNVTPSKEQVGLAYKEVLASLFSEEAVAYQKKLGYVPGGLRMPVACVTMVDAVSSGVIYTETPDFSRKDTLMITASWGLGESVVQGGTEADVFYVTKSPSLELVEASIGAKAVMTEMLKKGGTDEVATPEELRAKPCLDEQNIKELATLAMEIERHFKFPQDIEWALARNGDLYILQSRALALPQEEKDTGKSLPPDIGKFPDALMHNAGFVVQKGAVSGRVFMVKTPSEAAKVPRGAILVARNDSPKFIQGMTRAVAIITDTGSPASHMASLCREFRIPTLVNSGNATHVLRHGQEITLVAEDDKSSAVYDGRIPSLIAKGESRKRVEELYEFRKKKYIMKFIAPLNLVDPLVDEFTPEKCKTMHDILRFMHEKSVQSLIDASMHAGKSGALRRLELPVPAGIRVIDIGDGLAPGGGATVTAKDVTSVPFQALIRGMTHPGAWHTATVPLQMGDILTSISKLPSLTSDAASMTSNNIAVVSREYVNLSLKFGYHFNLIDCYLSDYQKNNHIYFRFVGGATDISKRSRRIHLLETILREFGFDSKVKGDLIVARISNIPAGETLRLLDQAGRLIAYTRQLDAVLTDDASVELYSRKFLDEKYTI